LNRFAFLFLILIFLGYKTMKIGGVAQIAECLLCSSKALSLKPSPTKKKRKKKKRMVHSHEENQKNSGKYKELGTFSSTISSPGGNHT
jgi:hypothetical protein